MKEPVSVLDGFASMSMLGIPRPMSTRTPSKMSNRPDPITMIRLYSDKSAPNVPARTPRRTKTRPMPMPKHKVRSTALVLLGCVEKERYAGNTGSVQGAKKVSTPAMNIMVASNSICFFGDTDPSICFSG